MNSNNPKSSTQINESSEISSIPNQNPSVSTQNIFPVKRVSILKTEEEKKVVRTNVYEPNDNNTVNNQKFCVVTEVIMRSSNISLDPQHNSFNNGPLNFSFNNITEDETKPINQSFQNKVLNIHIADSSSKKIDNNNLYLSNSTEYKSLIRKIAYQLKRRVRTPTQGYFYFAFQKGNYPLIIIRKIKNKMINHSIEFSNDIFRIYTQKYIKYRELIKRIAFLLKKSLKNIKFWENPKYSVQTTKNNLIQNENDNKKMKVKITQNVSDIKTSSSNNSNINTKDNKVKTNNIIAKKNVLSSKNNSKDYTSLNKNINYKNKNNSNNNLTNNKSQYNTNLNNHNQKKNKPQTNKITNFKYNINHSNNIEKISVKSKDYINPFVPVEDIKKINFSNKINDNIKKPILNKSQINNKDKNKSPNYNNISTNNINSIIESKPVTSTINKNEKIINVNINKNINIANQTDQINTFGHEIQIADKNKIDIIKEKIKPTQNNNTLNINIIKNINANNNTLNSNVNNVLNSNINNNINTNINNIVESNIYNNINTNINNILDSNINNNILNNNINNNMLNSNINNNMLYNNINNNILNKDEKIELISVQSEPILYNAESNDIEMKNNINKINSDIIPNKRENILEEKSINIENNIYYNKIINSDNNIVNNNNITNLNPERIPSNNNNYELDNINSADININKKTFVNMNLIPSNNNNILGITPNNNTLNDINNINSSNPYPLIIKEKNGQRLSFNSIKSPGKKIVIKLSTFKKKEEKPIISKDNSEDTIKDFIQKPISTTTTNIDNNTNTNQNISNISSSNIIQRNNNNTNLEKENSFVNTFNTELSSNNILIKDNLPIAKDENGQIYMKQYSFWDKYIQYLYNNYLINNEKISLFCFIQIIEQYFIWCENTNDEKNLNFKKLMIDTINKIYNDQEKNQFFSMNKINNLDELFKKYEIFMNKNKFADYKYGKEIEIKFDNCVECNCELCSNEIACMNRMSEINKNLITNVNTDNIFYSGIITKKNENNSKKEKEKEKEKNPKFSESKMQYSFEYQLRYIPQIKEEKEKENQESIKKSDNDSQKSRSMKRKKSEKYIEIYTDEKIDKYLDVSKFCEEKNEEKTEIKVENDRKSEKSEDKKKSSQKKEQKRKSSTIKSPEEESASKSEEKYLKNRKNKKNRKSKGRNKKKEVVIIDSDSDKSDNSRENSRNKKITYPKIAKKRGKK